MIRSRTAAEKKRQMEKVAARAAAAEAEAASSSSASQADEAEDEDESSGSETEREDNYRSTASRPKGESAQDKKARKAAVKAERSVRITFLLPCGRWQRLLYWTRDGNLTQLS